MNKMDDSEALHLESLFLHPSSLIPPPSSLLESLIPSSDCGCPQWQTVRLTMQSIMARASNTAA